MRHAVVLAAAAAALGLCEIAEIRRTSQPYGRHEPRVRYHVSPTGAPPTNGKREVARRLRQIAAGQLRVSVNG